MRAVDPDPGMPSASVGTIAPPAAELFAASGPTIPSGVPVPNSSFFLLKRLASLYPMIAATVERSDSRRAENAILKFFQLSPGRKLHGFCFDTLNSIVEGA